MDGMRVKILPPEESSDGRWKKLIRVQFDMTVERIADLDRLIEVTDINSRRDIFNNIPVGGTCQYADNNITFEEGETKRKVTVNTSYITTHTPTVRSRLLKAGVRLGHLLNGILGTTE
jgi:hypothetical protein